MLLSIPLSHDLSLTMSNGTASPGAYATAALQKGLLLRRGEMLLSEEAVGFGVPVLKRGLTTIFPGEVELAATEDGPIRLIQARFTLNLEERIAGSRSTIDGGVFYTVKNWTAAVIRHVTILRGALTDLSSLLRRLLRWETRYERSATSISLTLSFTIDPTAGTITTVVDLSSLGGHGVTEVVIMNELGANWFDRYHDESGVSLRGRAIGCWDEVEADGATFSSEQAGVSFSLDRIAGARLFRGRELVGTRLAWSGFGYSIPLIAVGSLRPFTYVLKLGGAH